MLYVFSRELLDAPGPPVYVRIESERPGPVGRARSEPIGAFLAVWFGLLLLCSCGTDCDSRAFCLFVLFLLLLYYYYCCCCTINNTVILRSIILCCTAGTEISI